DRLLHRRGLDVGRAGDVLRFERTFVPEPSQNFSQPTENQLVRVKSISQGSVVLISSDVLRTVQREVCRGRGLLRGMAEAEEMLLHKNPYVDFIYNDFSAHSPHQTSIV